MGNLTDAITGDEFGADILMGQTIDEANSFIKKKIVYFQKNDKNEISQRITEVCDGGFKDIRDRPGNMRLKVETNTYGKIVEIVSLG